MKKVGIKHVLVLLLHCLALIGCVEDNTVEAKFDVGQTVSFDWAKIKDKAFDLHDCQYWGTLRKTYRFESHRWYKVHVSCEDKNRTFMITQDMITGSCPTRETDEYCDLICGSMCGGTQIGDVCKCIKKDFQ